MCVTCAVRIVVLTLASAPFRISRLHFVFLLYICFGGHGYTCSFLLDVRVVKAVQANMCGRATTHDDYFTLTFPFSLQITLTVIKRNDGGRRVR